VNVDEPVSPSEVSGLLAEIRGGDERAWERLVERVYPEMHSLAQREMRREAPDHVLQTTALVHEAWVKLVQDPHERFEHRFHFFAAAARAMRRVLIDEARRRKAQKRSGAGARLSISSVIDDAHGGDVQDDVEKIEAVHTALQALEALEAHRDKARLVELRFFGGLTNEEAATVLGRSLASVKRDWEFARAWLQRHMERAG
jgi:RNA polymerase sigma factor (TIGR02999 family)